MYDLSVVKNLLTKSVYKQYRSYVKDTEIGPELRPVLRAIDEWYKNNSEEATLEDIANLTFAAGVPEKEKEFTKQLFHNLAAVNGTESVKLLLERFKTNALCQQISLAAYEASEGRRDLSSVLDLAEQLRDPGKDLEIEYVTDDLHTILRDTVLTKGLRWRLNSLNRALGSLRKGNFGFVFARPETGKTTFLASEITYMAEQLTPEQGPIIWLNNEQMGEDVKGTMYRGGLGCRMEDLMKYPDKAMAKYLEKTHGKLKLHDNASIHRRQVEAICEKERPSLLIFDQIDKVKGFKADREDLALGAIYIWAREIAKTYCPVIGICQASGDAEGLDWLYMDHVANAKTAKQAEADFILGIGKKHEAGFEEIRYINVCKNKLTGDNDTDRSNRHPKITVRIRPEIARYEDL